MESYLGKLVTVKMDRPLGSKHPKHNFIYSLNYGFIPNTASGDGEEIDVYIIGEFEPLETYEAPGGHRELDESIEIGINLSTYSASVIKEVKRKYLYEGMIKS